MLHRAALINATAGYRRTADAAATAGATGTGGGDDPSGRATWIKGGLRRGMRVAIERCASSIVVAPTAGLKKELHDRGRPLRLE
jgi:hypothetical protein